VRRPGEGTLPIATVERLTVQMENSEGPRFPLSSAASCSNRSQFTPPRFYAADVIFGLILGRLPAKSWPMAYDAQLAARIDHAVRDWRGFSTKKMFGSIGWMLKGNICAGIWKDSLIVRCGPTDWTALLREPHVAEFDITGRSMKGWLLIRPAAIADDGALNEWLQRSRSFVRTLPAKPTATKKKTRSAKIPTKRARTR
jgi:hypothetical protein